MIDKVETLITYAKNSEIPVLVDFLFGEDFPDETIINANINKTELASIYLTISDVYKNIGDLDKVLEYSQKVYDIKKSLGLPIPSTRPFVINPIPELLIFDRWVKKTGGRDEHRRRVYEILNSENIRYCIKTDL